MYLTIQDGMGVPLKHLLQRANPLYQRMNQIIEETIMEFINFENLVQQANKKRKHFVTPEARDLGNKLIFEYGITENDDLADFLKVYSSLNGQRAVRAWVQTQLSLLDSDETDYERYRQLRRLFQDSLPDFI